MYIGNYKFDTTDNTYIMGILNVTPDSFSDGGNYVNLDAALLQTEKMINEGAAIIDIGGESTRPGYTMISDDEEISRVVPVIEAIKNRFDIPISLDTYKSGVARAGLEAGADMINDIWGLKYDDQMAEVVKEYNKSVCIMHNRKNDIYSDLIADIKSDLSESIELAKKAGIDDELIMIDPGVGFAKSYENNLEVIARLEEFNELGYPVLLGSSRKSVIGLTLDLPAGERVEGTIATSVIAAMKKMAFVRVHDVAANYRAIKMTQKIMQYQNFGK